MKKIYLLLLCLTGVFSSFAQQGKILTEKDYAKSALWISMIKDTSVNFFEAEKAFKTYFKHHTKPEGENEDIGERGKREKHPGKRERRKLDAENRMRMEVKKYEHWHDMMLPYVQPNGHILTPTERLKIWSEQKSK